MSEVQKILSKLGHQLTEEAENGYITKLHLSATEQALYDLLMEKMPPNDNETIYNKTRAIGCVDDDAIKGYKLATKDMKSAINALFGRTE